MSYYCYVYGCKWRRYFTPDLLGYYDVCIRCARHRPAKLDADHD
jgi:hypothetical protein